MIPRIFFDIPEPYEFGMRYDLSKPFIEGDWLYSTDRRIIARRPVSLLTPDELRWYGRGKRKLIDEGKARQIWDMNVRARRGPALELPEIADTHRPCPECHPSSPWTWPFIPASGRYCEHCDGEGWTHVLDGIDLGPVVLNPVYVAMLRQNGLSVVTPGEGPTDPIHFAGDGFEGYVMPYDPKVFRVIREAAVAAAS